LRWASQLRSDISGARRSDLLDGQDKDIADTTFGPDNTRCAGINFELPSESKDLDIDAAVKHVLVNPRCLQEVFATQWPLWRVEERGQERVFTLGKRDRAPIDVRQTALTAIELPAAKAAPALFGFPMRCNPSKFLPTQYGTDAGEKFAKPERLGDIIICAEFKSHHPVDFIASVARGDDHRNIRTRPKLAQQIKTIVLSKPKVENDKVGLVGCELPPDVLSVQCRTHPDVVLLEVVQKHVLHRGVVIDDEDARRSTARLGTSCFNAH
jgi:hypothetical protein